MLSDFPIAPALPVSDLARARSFYEGTLGFTASEVNEEAGEAGYVSGGVAFLVYVTQWAGTNQATAAAWRVDDVVATMAELKGAGVTFEEYDLPGLKTVDGLLEMPAGQVAWFKDPDGNILAIEHFG